MMEKLVLMGGPNDHCYTCDRISHEHLEIGGDHEMARLVILCELRTNKDLEGSNLRHMVVLPDRC